MSTKSALSTSCASTRRCESICAGGFVGVSAVAVATAGGAVQLVRDDGVAPEFRALMRLDWSESQQRRFEWLLAALRLADRLIPHRAWIFGYRVYL